MRAFLLLAFGLVVSPVARAQRGASDLVGAGVRAYQNLELEAAGWMLRQSLTVEGAGHDDQTRALMYLVATELLRGRRDSAAAAGRRLLSLDPRYRPDPLVFAPEVQDFVGWLRRDTRAVAVRAGGQVTFRPKDESFGVTLLATAPHEITAAIACAGGEPHRVLYSGFVRDSLSLRWDGLDSTGGRTPSGAYVLTVTSRDERGRSVRTLRLPLEVTTVSDEIPAPPPPPPDSLLLPERRSGGPAFRALAMGLLGAAAVSFIPYAVAPDEGWTDARYLVGGTIALSGIIAFIVQAPGQPIADNVARNRERWAAWRNQVEATRARTTNRPTPTITVRPGDARVAVGGERP